LRHPDGLRIALGGIRHLPPLPLTVKASNSGMSLDEFRQRLLRLTEEEWTALASASLPFGEWWALPKPSPKGLRVCRSNMKSQGL
jgi:hypothetical protein